MKAKSTMIDAEPVILAYKAEEKDYVSLKTGTMHIYSSCLSN